MVRIFEVQTLGTRKKGRRNISLDAKCPISAYEVVVRIFKERPRPTEYRKLLKTLCIRQDDFVANGLALEGDTADPHVYKCTRSVPTVVASNQLVEHRETTV